jgi:hypothetical protein
MKEMADPAAPPGMYGPGNQPGGGAAPPPPKKGGGGLFAPKPKPGLDLNKHVADIAGEMNNISRRLMVLEERYTNLRKKTQLTDQNMLNNHKNLMTEMHAAHEQVDELRKHLDDITDKLKIIVRELKECAKHNEVEVLQKYINLWEPMNFITRDAATKLVKDDVEATFKELNIRMQEEDYIKEQIRIALRDLKLQ